MMMGLGSYGYGGPSSTSSATSLSSSSNLSALAPPFTVVDRYSSKPGSNSAVQYPELPYTPSCPPWQSYGSSLAQKPAEMEVDSTTRITSVPLPDDYSFQYPATMSNDLSQSFTWSGLSPSSKTSSGTFLFGDFGKMDSYYKPYVPSMVDHDSSLVSHSESGYDLLSSTGMGSADLPLQADYTHDLHGLEYHAPFHATWNGAFDGKLGKQAEASAPSFLDNATAVGFSAYNNPVQGNASRGQFSSVIARENSNGFSRMECKDNISHSVQSVNSNPLDSSRTTISGPSFTAQLAQPQGSSFYQTTSYSGSVSVTKPSPSLVIRPPPSSSATVTLKSPYGKTPNTANDVAFHPSEGLGKHNPLKGKESHILRNSEDEECSAFTSQLKRQRDGNSQFFSAKGDAPNQSNGSRVKFESPVRIIDATNGSSLSFDMGPDCLDHHTYAVDSPCWKGAPGSNFSPFDDVETESTHQLGSKIDKYGQMDLQHQTFPPPIDLVRSSPAKAGEDKLHAERGVSANPGSISEADCTEQSISAVKTMWKGSNLMGSRVQFSEDFDVPKNLSNEKESKSSGVASTSDLSFRGVAMGSVLNLGDTTEGDVAVRAAENVLSSPSSEDCVSEVAKSYGTQSPPKMDLAALVKTLYGVSDMLLFSCLNDSYALKDQEVEMIKQAIANLNKLSSKKKVDYFTESKEAPLLQQDTCDRVEENPNTHASHPASKHESENEESNKAHDCVSSVSRLSTDYVTLEKAGIFQSLDSPAAGDLDVLGDGAMSQAIKKVLEENFPCEKEMESQAQLFKNLWLDAEAKLCSISYRVRFERMKAEMQKFKTNLAKENGAALEKTPGSDSLGSLNVSKAENDLIPKPMNLSSICQANDVEASVVSRFDTLKLRDDLPSQEADKDTRQNLAVGPDGGKNQEQTDGDDVEASVMNRFRILKCRDDQEGKVDPIYSYMMPFFKGSGEDTRLNRNVEPHYSQTTGNNVSQESVFGQHRDGPTYEVVKDFFPALPPVEVKWSNAPRFQYSLGSSGNSSSDWEHVMKEEAWRFA